MSVLVHTCCGPCLGGSVDILKSDLGNETFSAYWYNPNIHPYLEYRERMLSFAKFCKQSDLMVVFGPGEYGLEYFLSRLNGRFGEDRCHECYRMRFEKAAQAAAQLSFRAFTTTLLVSPYQQHELIAETGKKVAKEFGIDFHYCDFRPGFKQTHEAVRQHELYKQKYCGCIFSEFSRFKDDKRYVLPVFALEKNTKSAGD